MDDDRRPSRSCRRRGRLPGVLCALCTALALAGCSGSSKPTHAQGSRTTTTRATSSTTNGKTSSTQATTSTVAQAPPSCSIASLSEVNDALGLNLQSASSQVTGATTLCTYAGASPGPVTISFQTGENASTFAAGKSAVEQTGETATDVPDLGDAAYSYAKGSGESEQSSLAVLTGSIEVVVTAPVPIDDIDALARQVLASL